MITTVCKISYGSQTVPPIVPAVQGDTGRAISFEIADFTPPAGATATYFILKPSGEAIYNSATITDNSILCELTAQSLAEAGENRMQVRVLQGENIVTSFEVILMVRTFLGDDAMESGTEMNIFDQAVEQATEQFQENAEQIVEEVIESIPADYTELTEEVSELNERIDNIDENMPLINLVPTGTKTTTVNGVTIAYDNGVITPSGTGTSSGGRLVHIADLPQTPAGTYTVSVSSNNQSDLPVMVQKTDGTILANIQSYGAGRTDHATFTLSAETDLFIGVNITNGRTYTETKLSLVKGSVALPYYPPTKRAVTDETARAEISALSDDVTAKYNASVHMMASNNGLSDLNDAEMNRIYLIVSTSGVTNLPVASSGTLFTFGRDVTVINQIYVTADGSDMYWRRKWASWGAWNRILKPNELPSAPLDVLTMFDNITCCGDSLTYSQVYTGASTSRQAYVTYPEVLEKITGTPVTALASAGYTAVNWWNAFANSVTEKTNQCAIIYLGANGGFTDTLATDAPENDDPSTWANTNTGCLAKIINKLQSVGAKIILVKCYATSGTGSSDLDTTNSVITQCANRFHTGLVDNPKLEDNICHMYPDRSGGNTVHYNDIGYSKFARQLDNNIANMNATYMQYIIPS